MKKKVKRWLSILLCLAMCLSSFPMTVFAEEAVDLAEPVQTESEPTEEPAAEPEPVEEAVESTAEPEEEIAEEPAAETTTYSITVASGMENGSVSADKKSAAAGETVTLTVTADDGCSVVCVKANGEEVCPDDAGAYAFTMPAEDVETTAEFVLTETDTEEDMLIDDVPMLASASTTSGNCGDSVTWLVSFMFLEISGSGKMQDYLSSEETPYYSSLYSGQISKLTITGTITRLGDYAFADAKECSTYDMSGNTGLTEIGNYTFKNNPKMEEFTLPDTIESIGQGAFKECISLATADFSKPTKLQAIPDYCFYNDTALKTVQLPSGLTKIGECAFYNCSSLTGLILENTITSFGKNAFYGVKNAITYNGTYEQLIAIDGYATCGTTNFICTRVSSVALNETEISLSVGASETLSATINPETATNQNIEWSSSNGAVATVDENGLVTAIARGEATITATTVDGGFAATCAVTVTQPVTGVSLDQSTVTINKGETARLTATVSPENANNPTVTWSSSDEAVATVDSEGVITAVSVGVATITVTTEDGGKTATCAATVKIVETIDNMTWEFKPSTSTLTISGTGAMPNYSKTEDQPWYDYVSSIKKVVVTGVTTIGDHAFCDLTKVTQYDIADTVISYGAYAFWANSSLKSFTMKDTVKSVGYGAFTYSGLTSIDLSNTLETIGGSAFANCALVNVVIPDSVTSLGSSVFYRNEWTLKSIKFPKSMKTIPGSVCQECYNLSTVILPEDVERIEANAFLFARLYNGLTLPDTLTYIGESAFRYSYGLKELTIPASVKYIGWTAFRKAGNANANFKVTILATGDVNYNGVFYECETLTDVTLTEGITSIGGSMFYGCTSLKNINIPSSVTSIGGSAFYNCTALTGLELPYSVKSLGGNAFAGVTNTIAYGGTQNLLPKISGYANCGTTNFTCTGIEVSEVALNNANLTVDANATATLTAIVSPEDAVEKAVTWSSDNTDVATVDENGVVTAVALGTATITATSVDGGKTATCEVLVPLHVSNVSLDKTEVTMVAGNTETLTATIEPTDADNQNVIWSSSNEEVATVVGGVVTAVARGEAIITATTEDGEKTATCAVTVEKAVASVTHTVEGYQEVTVYFSSLAAAVKDYTDNNYTTDSTEEGWHIIDRSGYIVLLAGTTENITVKSGVHMEIVFEEGVALTGTGSGSVITVESGASLLLYDAKITGGNAAQGGGICNKGSLELYYGAITGNVSQQGGGIYNAGSIVLFSTKICGNYADVARNQANNLYIAVGSNGEIIYTNGQIGITYEDTIGELPVIIYSIDDTQITSDNPTCSVVYHDEEESIELVGVAVTGVSLDNATLTVDKGETAQLTATIEPQNAYNQAVTWSSDNTEVATVNENGVVTAVALGRATITATTVDGGKTATCEVLVPLHVSNVSLDKTEVTMVAGNTETLTATIEPAEADNPNVIWSSSNAAVATVDGGIVTAFALGEAIITATTEDGGKTATCAVTVYSVNLDKTDMVVLPGETCTLTATVEPSSLASQNVTWSSSDETVATVDENGVVTAIKPGTVTITASESIASASCTVMVPAAVIRGFNGARYYSSVSEAIEAFGETNWDSWLHVYEDAVADTTIESGISITIYLHGHTITGTGNGSVFTVQSGASLELVDGCVQGGNAEKGGGICNYGSTTLYNIKVKYNTAKYGGGIYNEGTLATGYDDYECIEVTDNTASGNGGGIYNKGHLSVLMYSGMKVQSNTNKFEICEDEYYICDDNLYIADGSTFELINGGYSNPFSIGVTLQSECGTFCTATDCSETQCSWFTSDGCYIVEYNSSSKSFELVQPVACIVKYQEKTASDSENEYEEEFPEWEEVVAVYSTLTAAVNAFDDYDVANYGIMIINDVTENIVIKNGQNVRIESEYATLSGTGSGSVITVEKGGRLLLRNVPVTGGNATYGGGICNYGELTLQWANFSNNTATYGGGVYNAGSLTCVGNSVFSSNTADYGGGVYIASGATSTTLSGEINDNTANNAGGAIYAEAFFTYCGPSANNKALEHGGIYAGNGLKLSAGYVYILYNYSGYDANNPSGTTREDIFLPKGKMITVEGELDGLVGVMLESGQGQFATAASEDVKEHFCANDTTCVVGYNNGSLELRHPVTGVSLDNATLTVDIDKTAQLTATIEPQNAYNQAVTWSSDNTEVATVDENGIVYGVWVGEATITATTEDGGKTASCVVTVPEPVALIVRDISDEDGEIISCFTSMQDAVDAFNYTDELQHRSV